MGTRVYVGGLSYRVRERDVEKCFKKYGRLREVSLKNGYGFVEFDDYRDADDAVYELNGKELMGERITVERARGTPHGRDQWMGSGRSYRPSPRRPSWLDKVGTSSSGRRWIDERGEGRIRRYGPPTRTEYRIIVENLSSRVSWQDLKDYMRQAGEVTYADAHKQHRNEGVVEFASYSDMKTALEKLDDTELNGRRIHLVEESRRRRRSRSMSRSRSRSHSHRRSHSRSRSRSQSRSHSPRMSHSRSKELSKSRSRTPSRSKSREKSFSQSPSGMRNDRSRSQSAEINGDGSPDGKED